MVHLACATVSECLWGGGQILSPSRPKLASTEETVAEKAVARGGTAT